MNCGCQNGLEIARFLFEAVLKYGHAASEGNGVDAVAKPAQASRETRLIEARNCVLVSLFVQGDEDKESGGRSGTSHYSTLFALPPQHLPVFRLTKTKFSTVYGLTWNAKFLRLEEH